MSDSALIRVTAGEGTAGSILDAARKLFLTDGYDGVNLDRIAQEAGVARQTIYNRFGGKEAVFREMLQHHWDRLDISTIIDELNGPAGTSDASQTLRAFARLLVRFVDETDQIAVIRLVIAESRRLPWLSEEFYRVGKAPLLDGLVASLERLNGMGLLNCPDTFLAAHQYFGLVQEMIVWPSVMGVSEILEHVPSAERVIDEAILTFLSRFAP